MKSGLPLFLSALLWAGTAMATEEPSYQLLSEAEGYEVRRYPPYVVAELRAAGASFEQAGSEAFRPLADFVFGDNSAAEEIGMTAPVTQRSGDGPGERIGMTAPVTQSSAEGGGYVIRFVMPSRYTLETVPRPNDPRIRLRQQPEQVVAVLRYSGWWSEERYRDRLERLRAALARDAVTVTGDPVWARFNSPFQLWFLRRNEIWLPVDAETVRAPG